ncbi:MAG: SLC26A/SulP transporter family protein [Deltaproteobacteria bacterium]|nr:SLC26A/SulP transporter family protein [Deltaproteobacteria bacterium]MBW2284606.1 SLC26A/SulP transporter family protein [Deltaproteobacteria bacterium]
MSKPPAVSHWRQIPTQLLDDLKPSRLAPSALAGVVIGALTVMLTVSLAALIFSGRLSVFLPQGIVLGLFSAVLANIIVALTSSFRGSIAVPHDRIAPILALMAGAVVTQMSMASTGEIFLTVVAVFMVTGVTTGGFLLLLGISKMGGLTKFIPYPVMGGFMAGTGWLLVVGSMGVMTESTPAVSQILPLLLKSGTLARWLSGMLFAVILVIVMRKHKHSLLMPAVLLGGIVLFYMILFGMGVSVTQARSHGWLLGPFPHFQSGVLAPLSVLEEAHWPVVFQQFGSVLTIVVVSAMSVLLNCSAIELLTKKDVDLNRELLSAGVANMGIGSGGGMVSVQSLSLAGLASSLGALTRLSGIFSALFCTIVLFWGTAFLSFFPIPILGGLLMYLGLSLLLEWTYDAWFKLPKTDYVVIILILGTVGAVGYLGGVALGIITALILFVINYSRINVVKHTLTGVIHKSNVDRPSGHRKILDEKGEQIHILKLQGFIFFGTASNLMEKVRERALRADIPHLRFVVLDFTHVTDLDSSAVIGFVKMKQLGEKEDFMIVITHPSDKIVRQLIRGGVHGGDRTFFRMFPDLDHGIEWCENQILLSENIRGDSEESAMEDLLKEAFPDSREAVSLLAYLERKEVEKGYYLIRQGESADDMFFIESGRVTTVLELEDGGTVRLRTMRAGTVVGEVGFYLGVPRTASVVTEQPGVIHRFSQKALEKMETEAPSLAADFHAYMARMLADRLAHATRAIQALLD